MPHVDAHQPGTPCWLELSTIDPASAKTFYQGLFGWKYHEVPSAPDMPPYILAWVKEQREQGMPPFWLMYVSVANVDQTVPKITALGGQVMAGPFDVPQAGRMAV